jgi:hypothetical protein
VLLIALVVGLAMTAGPVVAGGGGNDDGGNGKGKVCVKHFTGSKTNPYNYIFIPKKAFDNGHKQHGDKIVAKKFCEKKGNNNGNGDNGNGDNGEDDNGNNH